MTTKPAVPVNLDNTRENPLEETFEDMLRDYRKRHPHRHKALEEAGKSLEEEGTQPDMDDPDENEQTLKASFEDVCALVAALPRKQQLALVEKFAVTSEPPPKPDISHIPLWGGKRKDGPALDWLRAHYGEYLVTCGAPENRIYRQDVEDHDKKLINGIEREAHAQGKKPREFLPTRSDATDDRAKALGFDEEGRPVEGPARLVQHTAGTLRGRKWRQKQAEAPTADPS